MKTSIFAAFALLGAAYVAGSDTTCNLAAVEAKLTTELAKNTTRKVKVNAAQVKCETETGIDIFTIDKFPKKEKAQIAQGNLACSEFINAVNTYANSEIQCNVTVSGISTNYQRLISDFLDGKTGNESDSDSGSVDAPSESNSGSESESGSSSTSASSSGSSNIALSFVTYGAIAAIAVALR